MLLDLWVAAWTEAMPAIDFEARRGWFAERLDQHQHGGALLIAARSEPSELLLGFALVDPTTRYLDQLAVGPDHQGRGVAGLLVAEAKRLSPAGLALHVNQDNARAVRFYHRQGFVVAGEGRNPRSGLPIWTMRWERGAAEG